MPHKEPVSQGVVHFVIERYEEQQSSPRIEGQSQSSQSRYEPMTELSSRTMRTLFGELTRNIVEQANCNNGPKNGNFVANEGPTIRPQINQPVNQDVGVLYDPNVMLRNQNLEIVHDQMVFGVRHVIRPTYTKPYSDWADQTYLWPRGYKVPEFSLFTSLGEMSTLAHIRRFTLQIGEVNDYHKMRLFPSSLT
ncbi:unnamed protein product [Fraxinus pennsylvanica]|uniref:Uncharacterized protein n=1 Tax=Fraxinus pennsylvanica TaxID=56036 RepID=A0AAD2DNZ5_9LAMI|nr:unnamed protein product [Fraxinus pennsylvanica]